ncbi:MAG TPA: sigma-70 family RNA polymerase sigma factor, partial [Terriglobales bacterium]|nr:sigma-70 family RNA polymerase sigma factor [Terriglobales bacterium]
MQEAQTYLGSEPRFTPCNVHNVKEEMNETLSRYRAAFFRRAYLVLENAADAEDAVQDALLSAYKHIDQFRGEAQLSTWLTAIVSNSARMQLRRRPRHIHVSLDEPVGEEQEHSAAEQLADGRQNPEDECRSTELHARLKNLLTELPPSLRRVFQLRDLDGLTTREAANLLGVADGTVKGQLAKA